MLDALLRILALTAQGIAGRAQRSAQPLQPALPPIMQCLIFGYAATYDLNDVPYAVLDQDRSAASHELLAGLDGSGVFHRVADLDTQPTSLKTIINDSAGPCW